MKFATRPDTFSDLPKLADTEGILFIGIFGKFNWVLTFGEFQVENDVCANAGPTNCPDKIRKCMDFQSCRFSEFQKCDFNKFREFYFLESCISEHLFFD